MDSPKGRIAALFLFFIFLGFLLARLFLSRENAPPVADAAPPAPAVVAAPTPTVVKKPAPVPAEKKGKKIAAQRDHDPSDENMIPFRVENGMAVAFGDIILGNPEDPELKEGFADIPSPQLWDRPEIPYAISEKLTNPQRVEQAVAYFQKHTPVRLIPFTGQSDVIVFEPTEEHCYSLLGRSGGAQPIRIAPSCGWHEIAHELMHALGFVHEQSRKDRDQFVQIVWDNIEEKFKQQFAMVPDSFQSALRGTTFDYSSIMLYRADMFQKAPGLVTMRSLGTLPINPVGQGLSEGDIERLRRLYH